jgi:surface carbohydrate biosynthesis protein
MIQYEKIIIVIDEPKRDLAPLLFLATKLVKKNYQVYLISFSQLSKIEKSFFKNSILIINYFRFNNLHFLIWIKIFCKTRIIVYDTEGVGSRDGYQVVRIIKKYEYFHDIIDQYWLWNNVILNELKKFNFKNDIFFTVGNYRFSQHFLESRKINNDSKKQILINTNFAFISPKYSRGPQQELKSAQSTCDPATSEDLDHYFNVRKKFLDIIKNIISYYSNETFVLRSHPFENNIFWTKNLSEFKNVIFRSDGDVIDELPISKFVIHNNCSTAVEALNLNVPSISFDWLFNSKFDPYFPRLASIKCKNINDVFDNINKILSQNFSEFKKIDKNLVNAHYKDIYTTNDIFDTCVNLISLIQIKVIKLKFGYFKYLFINILYKLANLFFERKKIIYDKLLNQEKIMNEFNKMKNTECKLLVINDKVYSILNKN